jgi:outer membrane protein TolC
LHALRKSGALVADKLAEEAAGEKRLYAGGKNSEEVETRGRSRERHRQERRPTGIDVLTSEQLLLSTKLSRITTEASRYADIVTLFQSLGGGWWNRSDVEQARDPSLLSGALPSSKQ